MLIGQRGGFAPAGGAAEEADFQQKRLDHIDQRIAFLIQRGRQCLDADRAALIKVDDGAQQFAVEIIQPALIDTLRDTAPGRRSRG